MNRCLLFCIIFATSCQFYNKNENEQTLVGESQTCATSIRDSLSGTIDIYKDSCLQITTLSQTTDQILIDSVYYLMIKSPLSYFNGYKKIFNDFPEVQTIEVKIDLGAALVLPLDNKYQCFWWLKDGMLYLSDITFFTVNKDQVNYVFPDKKHYAIMENLTKKKFNKHIASIPNFHERPSHLNDEGMMPAMWFSDTLLVKEVKKSNESYDEWNNKGCRKLVFIEGRIEKIE